MLAFELFRPNEDDPIAYVLGDITEVVRACAGRRVDVVRNRTLEWELHQGHPDVDFVLPRDASRMIVHLQALGL